jgi:hypothetical protein
LQKINARSRSQTAKCHSGTPPAFLSIGCACITTDAPLTRYERHLVKVPLPPSSLLPICLKLASSIDLACAIARSWGRVALATREEASRNSCCSYLPNTYRPGLRTGDFRVSETRRCNLAFLSVSVPVHLPVGSGTELHEQENVSAWALTASTPCLAALLSRPSRPGT